MISIQSGLYVRIAQLEGERVPQPLPLSSGFSLDFAYFVLGVFSASETSEAYLILTNDRDEIWFISNRHVRVHAFWPNNHELRVPLDDSIDESFAAAQHVWGRDGKIAPIVEEASS